MNLETQQRLFDPFFSTKMMGRGLGMSAILGIVRAHQGAIFVDSVVGEGTTIQVLFPAGETAADAIRSETDKATFLPPKPQAASAGAIMVVDDEEMVRKVCSLMLRRLGWLVITAANGPEAIELYRRDFAGVVAVILDQSMPQMDGITVFKELRAINPAAKVILSSGYSHDHRPGQSPLTEGISGFIQKPYSIEGLRQQLDGIAGRTR